MGALAAWLMAGHLCTQAEHGDMRTGTWVDADGENPVSFERRVAARDFVDDKVAWQLWLMVIAPHSERPRRRAVDGSILEGREPQELA